MRRFNRQCRYHGAGQFFASGIYLPASGYHGLPASTRASSGATDRHCNQQ